MDWPGRTCKGGLASALTLWAIRPCFRRRHRFSAGRRRHQRRRPVDGPRHRARGHRGARQRRPRHGGPRQARRECEGPHRLQYPLPPRTHRQQRSVCRGGATIVAHDRTRQWGTVDHRLPDQNRHQKARPKAAWPTEVVFNTGSKTIAGERIEYGYLLAAHAAGDIYVTSGRERAGRGRRGVARHDPELDWIIGAWIWRTFQRDGCAAEDPTTRRAWFRNRPMMTGPIQGRARPDGGRPAAAVQADSAG